MLSPYLRLPLIHQSEQFILIAANLQMAAVTVARRHHLTATYSFDNRRHGMKVSPCSWTACLATAPIASAPKIRPPFEEPDYGEPPPAGRRSGTAGDCSDWHGTWAGNTSLRCGVADRIRSGAYFRRRDAAFCLSTWPGVSAAVAAVFCGRRRVTPRLYDDAAGINARDLFPVCSDAVLQ